MNFVDLVWNCPYCGTLNHMRVGAIGDGPVPLIPWDIAANEEFQCNECEKSVWTSDFEMLTEDEI